MIYCWPPTRYKIRVIKLYKLPTITRLCLEEYFVLIVFNPCSVIKMEDAILYGLEKLNFTESCVQIKEMLSRDMLVEKMFFGKSITFDIAPLANIELFERQDRIA